MRPTVWLGRHEGDPPTGSPRRSEVVPSGCCHGNAHRSVHLGSIRIDGVTYEHDVVIAGGRVHKRTKKRSKPFRDAFGHTPLSIEEDIPWDCRRLVVGTGASGALPVMDEVKQEAARRQVALVTIPTREAIEALQAEPENTNAILHVTC